MKQTVFDDLVADVHIKRTNLMNGKHSDYATVDVLSNGKRMAELCNILDLHPSRGGCDSFLFLALLKMDRWINLRHSRQAPQNEPIVDTLMDLHNYLDLAYASQVEEDGR